MRRLLVGTVLCAGAGSAAAQDGIPSVQALVTAVGGPNVYLDRGADSGVEPGQRARATPPGGVAVEMIVRSVSRQSARCEVLGGEAAISVGTPVEVFTPKLSAANGEAPTWSYQEQGWSADMPLLAPVQGIKPSERDSRLSGRIFQSYDWTRDTQDVDQEYAFSRTGLEARYENALGRGDEFVFDGELFHRASTVDGVDDEDTTRGRIDRFSWRIGDSRETDRRIEVGRFLSSELSQFGVIDGVEYVKRTESGNRWGGSVGLLPAWNDVLSTGDDVQASVFYRAFAGDKNELSAAGGYQKTWHNGEADRDLFVADANWAASEHWRFGGAAWLDWYDSGDAPKDTGFELTQMFANAMWTPSSNGGVSANYSHIRWPVLLRDELPPVTLATLADTTLDRVGVSAWRNLTKDVRLYGRVDEWSNSSDSGFGGELQLSWRNLVLDNGELSVSYFTTEGEFTSLDGVRLGCRKWGSFGAWFASLELVQQDVVGVDAINQQVVRTGWDGSLTKDWTLSLHADLRAGDDQDALSLGFFLQRRF